MEKSAQIDRPRGGAESDRRSRSADVEQDNGAALTPVSQPVGAASPAEQRPQFLLALQRTVGNQATAKRLAVRSEGSVGPAIVQRQPPSGGAGQGPTQNHEYVPMLSVKPDAAQINVGQEHTERLEVLNARLAPPHTNFHWGGGVGTANNVLEFVDLSPTESPRAKLRVKGGAPGASELSASVQHQVPGGPPVITEGPRPPVTVRNPTVQMKVTQREDAVPGAGNPGDATRLSVGDKLVVTWTFGNVQGLGTGNLASAVIFAGPGLNAVLAPEGDQWKGDNTYETKFRAVAVGAANLSIAFRFGDMTPDQEIKDTVGGHVEMSRQEFIDATVHSTAMIVTADQKATAWMDSLAVAYSDAWANHTNALKDQAAFEKLVGDLILGAALAFVPGGVGGVIGKAMGNATLGKAFLSDGVKDLAKWGMRTLGSKIPTTSGDEGLTAYPTDPFQWRSLKGVRMHSEMGMAAQSNESWIAKARARDPDFMLDFDPAKVMQDALKIDGNDLRGLTPVDMDAQSKIFEKGFWSKWLETYGWTVSRTTDNLWGNPIQYSATKNAGKKVKKRCEELGLDITPYMEASRRKAEADAAEKTKAANG